VAIGFPKPARYYGSSITDREQLVAAADAFKKQYLADMALAAAESGDATSSASEDAVAAAAAGGRGEGGAGKVMLRCCSRPLVAEDAPDDKAVPKYPTSAWRQYVTLLWRELLSITRNPFDVAGRTLTFAWVGLFMGILNFGSAVS